MAACGVVQVYVYVSHQGVGAHVYIYGVGSPSVLRGSLFTQYTRADLRLAKAVTTRVPVAIATAHAAASLRTRGTHKTAE